MALSRRLPDASPDTTKERVASLIPALRAFARTFTVNPADGDDLVQETLVRALRSLESFRAGTSLKSWLFTIMRNTYCTQYRKRVRESPGATDCVSLQLVTAAGQEWSVAESEVKAALSRLSEDQQQILIMVAGFGLSYEEAACVTDCAVGTVKSRLNRAREALAQEMGGNPLR
ncbi:UNVERIFIED_ORG: RNA polymerase sigma-70 factor (ECF subfamily) [Shinella zoogloeoides]|nr:RNA polymerase sigma-70 factor (ECF subfamily) [Shinella zoogloeoides]